MTGTTLMRTSGNPEPHDPGVRPLRSALTEDEMITSACSSSWAEMRSPRSASIPANGCWAVASATCRLPREGVVVLGITRARGGYIGAPPASTEFEPGDTLVLYGQADALDELRRRRAGIAGEQEHEWAKARHSALVRREAAAEARHKERRSEGCTHFPHLRTCQIGESSPCAAALRWRSEF